MRRENNVLMKKYPLPKRNVMVYDNKKGRPLLLNPYRALARKLSVLSEDEALLLRELSGNKTAEDICRNLPIEQKLILEMLKKWSGKKCNMIRLLEAPLDKTGRERKRQAKYENIYRQWRQEVKSAQEAGGDNTVLKGYHKKEIRRAREQFDDIETTVSHLYSKPHIILGGRSYAACFADVLIKEGAIRSGIEILEIGGGTGIFARCFLDEISKAAPEAYKNIRYSLFEISPALLKSQQKMLKRHCGRTEFMRGDIEAYDFKNKKFDLIISNEMIADLNTVKLRRADIRRPRPLSGYKKRAASLIKRFKLNIEDAPEDFLFNLGAVELLQDIKKILKADGKAWIIEYGSEWSYPKAMRLKGHTEYSIHFGFLKKVAAGLKLNPAIGPLVNFLPFNKNIRVINGISFFFINDYLLPFLGRKKIPKGVYTEEMIREKIGKIFDRLSFVGLTYPGRGEAFLDPANFLVLSLKMGRRRSFAHGQ